MKLDFDNELFGVTELAQTGHPKNFKQMFLLRTFYLRHKTFKQYN
jgi:hypothetical protein